MENRTVQLLMVKQGDMKEKRLTLECVQAFRNFIKAWKLVANDYFVDTADK